MDFDPYVKEYSTHITRAIPFCKSEHNVFVEIKAHYLLHLVRQACGPTQGLTALDVGCGVGMMEHSITPYFQHVYGVDITFEGIKKACQTVTDATFLQFDGACLPFPDETFDVAFAVCVMHHVPPPQWRDFTLEMARVVKPGGLVIVFEHNPFNPLTRVSVSRCEFDRDATLLPRRQTYDLLKNAGVTELQDRFILCFPWSGKFWRRVERALHQLPLGAQYYVAGRKRQHDIEGKQISTL